MNAVDTNVLIYACDARDPKRREAARAIMTGLAEPVLLWQVACEFIAASRKLETQGFTAHAAWGQLTALCEAWRLVVPEPAVLPRAQTLHTSHQTSFWDAMLFAACLEAGVTRLYTEDLPGTAIAGLEIQNRFA
jgi:predicted nucleic acid-binding protein